MRSRGFTLVEVLVALTILSMVMLATVTGLRTLASTQVAIERKTTKVDEVRTVSSFLRNTFESAIVGSGSGGLTLGAGSREATYFNFGDDFFEFKSTILFGEAFGGTHVIRVGREADALILRWQEPRIGDDNYRWEGTPSRALVTDLEEFSIDMKQDFWGDWEERWRGNDPPALVRVRLKSDGRYWPDLEMRVER